MSYRALDHNLTGRWTKCYRALDHIYRAINYVVQGCGPGPWTCPPVPFFIVNLKIGK